MLTLGQLLRVTGQKMNKIRIIVADRQKMVGEGLRSLINTRDEFEYVGFAAGGIKLLTLLEEETADLVIMDVTMPEMDGIDTTRALRKKYPELKILAYSALNTIEFINSMRIEGARGYVLKNGNENELFDAIRLIMKGHEYLSPEVKKTIDKGYDYTFKDFKGEYVGLTEREREIIKMVALERTNGEIASQLFLSVDTVKTHRKNLMTKLNVRNVAGLVRYAVDRGWV